MPSDNSSSACQPMRRKPEPEEDKISSGCGGDNDNGSGSSRREDSRSTWQSVKYYFNRFRYYHFRAVETLDLYASAACLWLINLYLRYFMGVGPVGPSVLNDADDD